MATYGRKLKLHTYYCPTFASCSRLIRKIRRGPGNVQICAESAVLIYHCQQLLLKSLKFFGPIADISIMRLSASWCHFQQCLWDGGCGWALPKGANSLVASGLVARNDLVGTGRAISVLFGINGVRNKQSHLVGPPFPAFKAHFSAMAGWHFCRDLTRCLLIGGYGQSHESLKDGWNYLWEQFWA